MSEAPVQGPVVDPYTTEASDGNGVELDMDQLRDFCNGLLQGMRNDLDGVVRQIHDVPDGHEMFSRAAAGYDLATQYRNAKAIYLETARGLAADLEGLQTKLREQLDHYQRADDDAAAALLALARGTDLSTTYASDTAYQQAAARPDLNAAMEQDSGDQPTDEPAADPTPTPTPRPVPTIRAATPADAPAATPEAPTVDESGVGF